MFFKMFFTAQIVAPPPLTCYSRAAEPSELTAMFPMTNASEARPET